MIFNAKNVFLVVNASLSGLNNVSGVYKIPRFPCFFVVNRVFLGHFFRYLPLLPISWRIVQIFTPTSEENYQLVQASSQSIFINEQL
jgi:hypothetical protein